jgi:hypothetical protein
MNAHHARPNVGTGTYHGILLWTSRSISRDASSPDSILPICSGGIDAANLALNLSPSLKGMLGATRTTAMRASCIEGASMMTIPVVGWRGWPKVSKKWGMQGQGFHRFVGRATDGFHRKGVTARGAVELASALGSAGTLGVF